VVNPKFDFSTDTSDGGGMYRLSRCVLLAHEDKVFQGAIVASMSIPWGETKGDNDLGGYHLVWTRDLVKSATALLATGQTGTPLKGPLQHRVSWSRDSLVTTSALIRPTPRPLILTLIRTQR